MGKKEEDQSTRLIRCGIDVVCGGILALAVCFLFLLGASAAISVGAVGEQMLYQLTVAGCVLGSFAGGTFAVKRCGGALLTGLTTGCVLFLLMLTIGTLCFDTVSLEEGGLGLLGGVLCGGAAAGLMGSGRGMDSRKKRRKR